MERIWLQPAHEAQPAPPLLARHWLNSGERPLALEQLRGRVVVLQAFQMLCPACILHALPQAARIQAAFEPNEVVVLGVHARFEHDDPTPTRALTSFLYEYGVDMPVAVDVASLGGRTPTVTEAYGFAGTPSMVLIDREGLLRAHVLGRPSDLLVGASIATLLAEEPVRPVVRTRPRLVKPAEAVSSNSDWPDGYP
jgi:thiol-disulfide isomerase/thioredoxin